MSAANRPLQREKNMTAVHITPATQPVLACTDLIQMIRDGMVIRLKRFIVEPYDDGTTWCIQTVAIAIPDRPHGDRFPIVVMNFHESDQEAMTFALNVFEAFKEAGRASVENVAQWRRGLFTLVPSAQDRFAESDDR